MYKIFLDQNRIFECDIKIDGASMDKSEARLFLETENFNLSFKGEIKSNGVVKIPINRLKGILDENSSGNIHLEVIAEDTIFKPWKDTYKTEISKKVEVNVSENLNQSEELFNKPSVSVSLRNHDNNTIDIEYHRNKINKILEHNNVNRKKLSEKPSILNKLLEKYVSLNNIDNDEDIKLLKRDILRKLL